MIDTQALKIVNLTPPAAIVNNAGFTVAALDTKGFDYVDFYVILGATDIAVATMKLTSSDASGSGYTDFVGSRYGTDGSNTLPSATDDNHIFAWHVDLKGKQRYWKPALTAGSGSTGTYACIIAVLSRAQQAPYTASDRGLAEEYTLL